MAQEIIPAKGHVEVVDTAINATCITGGMTAGKHCSVCNEVLVAQKEIPATGEHNYGEWAVTKEATVEAEGEESRNCTVCNAVERRSVEKLPFEETVTEEATTEKPADETVTYEETTAEKLPPEETDTKEVITEKPVVETSTDSQTDTEQQTEATTSGCQGSIGMGIFAMLSFVSAFAVVLLKKREE